MGAEGSTHGPCKQGGKTPLGSFALVWVLRSRHFMGGVPWMSTHSSSDPRRSAKPTWSSANLLHVILPRIKPGVFEACTFPTWRLKSISIKHKIQVDRGDPSGSRKASGGTKIGLG